MSRLILPMRRQSPFAFPGGNPGFDPSHPMSEGLRFSAVSSGGANFVNLLNGQSGTIAFGPPNPSAVMDGRVGPSVSIPDAALNYAGLPLVSSPPYLVFAGIIVPAAADLSATFTDIMLDVGAFDFGMGNEVFIGFNGGLYLSGSVGRSGFFPSPALIAGVPYFFCWLSAYNFCVITNLATGQIVSGYGNGASPNTAIPIRSTTNGTHIGGQSGFSGSIAAVAASYQAFSIPQALQWAQDPWAFWYPHTLDLATMLAKASSGNSYSLAGAEGAFAISGQAAALSKALHMAGVEGAFVVGGKSSTELRVINLAGAEGAFTIGGQTAVLNKGRGVAGVEGSFTIGGQASTEQRAPNIQGAEGAFTIGGQSAKFPVALSMHGAEGSFTIGGRTGTLNYVPVGSLDNYPGYGPQINAPGAPQAPGGNPQVPVPPR